MTLRAAILALIFVLILSFLSPYIEFIIWGTQIGSIAPPAGALLLLISLVIVINPILKGLGRWKIVRPFNQAELLTIYFVLLAVAVITSCQFAQWIVPAITGRFYYYPASINPWGAKLNPLLPKWWYPDDTEAITSFYQGLQKGEPIPWKAWTKPLVTWGPFIFVFYLTFLCISVVLRKQWIEKEKLVFPLVHLPLEMTQESEKDHGSLLSPFFRNKLVWFGVLIPVVVHTFNGLHSYFTFMPQIKLRQIQLGTYFPYRPWSAINPFFVEIHFALIGFAFLLSRDIPFSMWFFYLFRKLECVIGARAGLETGEDFGLRATLFPFVESQHTGGLLAFVLLTLWVARPHLKEVWRKAFHRGAPGSDPEEPMPYRWALLGIFMGILFLSLWCSASGMHFLIALILFTLTFIFMIGVHRMMAEGGVNFLWAAQSSPNYLIHSLGGGTFLDAKNWMILLVLPYFIWHFKGPVGPHTLEGFKIADVINLKSRALVPLIIISIIIAIVASYWSVIYLVYSHGGGVALCEYRFVHVGERPFDELRAVVDYPEGFSVVRTLSIIISAFFTLFLALMRWRFLWWPFHPIGYVTSNIFAMGFMWFSMFLGSTTNFLIMHYGGLKAYRKARLFFLGLIFGDFLMIGIWEIINGFTGVRGYHTAGTGL